MELQKTEISKLPVKGLLKAYQQDVKQFNNFISGQPITPDIIKSYFDNMKTAGRSPATIQRHKSSIKKSMFKAMGEGARLIEKAQLDNFFKEIKPGKRDIAITKDKVLSKQEYKDLIAKSGIKTHLIIRALFETASRVSELVSIKLSDCQERGQGVIIKTLGKGEKEGTFYMTLNLFEVIKETYKGEIYLFENSQGGHISRMSVYTMVKSAGERIGRSDISPHSIRHTWATLSMPVLGLSKVSGYLRHSDTSTTAKYYLHGKPEMTDIMSVNQLNQAV